MNPSEVENLKDVFKCFICMEKLKDARLCPHCSKFCCFLCIRRWLTEQRPQCPHCRCALQVNHLVKCRWAEEVTTTLEGMGPDSAAAASRPSPSASSSRLLEPDRCREHCEKLSVFCMSCEACICHHCALWGGFHAGHTLKPLDDEYRERAKQISEEVKKLRHRLCLLLTSIQQLETNIEEVREAKEERVEETRMAMELMVARLDSQMKSRLVSLTGQKRTIGMEVEMVEGVLGEVETQLATAPHSHLIAASPELFRMLTQIQRSPPAPPLHISPAFASEVVPEYEGRGLLLARYSELRRKGEPVYSQPLALNGLLWRLKVYPDGNGVVKGAHLSVFLELTKGPPGQARYEYRVEMLHQASDGDPESSVIREFGSEFEVGECWGYNRFFKLDCLLPEGFLDPATDSLRLHFKVRPPTYFQKAKDLEWYLAEKDREVVGEPAGSEVPSSTTSPTKAGGGAEEAGTLRAPALKAASSASLFSPPLPSPPSEKDIEEEGSRPATNDVDEARRVDEGRQAWMDQRRAINSAAALNAFALGDRPPHDNEESETESELGFASARLAHSYIPPPHHIAGAASTVHASPTPHFREVGATAAGDVQPWFNALCNATQAEAVTATASRHLPQVTAAADSPRRRRGRGGLSRSSSLDALCTDPE